MALAAVPALLLSQVCTDVSFEGAIMSVANMGGNQYCCQVCRDNDKELCCPAKDENGMVPVTPPPPRHARGRP